MPVDQEQRAAALEEIRAVLVEQLAKLDSMDERVLGNDINAAIEKFNARLGTQAGLRAADLTKRDFMN